MTKTHHLLFVCTANICRSPMAEGLARDYAARRGWPVQVSSGGVMGLIGHRAEAKAIKVMTEIGVDISSHRSKGLDEAIIDQADYILAMELAHLMRIHERFPAAEGKAMLLGTFAGTHEVHDPMGKWTFQFRKTRDLLRRAVESFMDQLPPPATAG